MSSPVTSRPTGILGFVGLEPAARHGRHHSNHTRSAGARFSNSTATRVLSPTPVSVTAFLVIAEAEAEAVSTTSVPVEAGVSFNVAVAAEVGHGSHPRI